MEMKHTPGPWEVISADWDENGDARYSLNGIKEVNICDARLIAAAPDLLEALSAFIGMIDCGNENPQEIVNQGRSAIAKATGEDK